MTREIEKIDENYRFIVNVNSDNGAFVRFRIIFYIVDDTFFLFFFFFFFSNFEANTYTTIYITIPRKTLKRVCCHSFLPFLPLSNNSARLDSP